MNISFLFWRILAVYLLASTARAGDAPQIIWSSDPVRPGETLVLQGANFGTNPMVEIRAGKALTGAWTRAEILQRSEDNLKIVMPADWPMGAFACRVADSGEVVSPVSWINVPDVWWAQGDLGKAASPGGWLRMFGRNLNFGGQSTVRLEGETTGEVKLEATNADCYSLCFALPQSLPAGTCNVQVHNGLAGAEPWLGEIIIQSPPAWPTNVFSVVESLGKDAEKEMRKSLVKYRDVKDGTAGIEAALKQAKENGGGVVYFPAGRYGITNELAVPPHTILRGEGEGLVVLWWGQGRFNLDGGSNLGYERATNAAKVPPRLISGRDFTLENLSLYVPPDYQTVIDGHENVRVRHVRVRIDHYWTLHTQRYEGWVARLGNHCEVSDCDIQAKGGGISPGRFCVIARNRLTAGKTPCPLGGSRQVIVEDNQFVSTHPTAYQNISGHGKNLYYARNTHEALNVHQADFSFTFDAGTSAYLGKIAKADGTNLTLAADPVFAPWAKETSSYWKEAVVCVLDGHGAGQYRDVVANQGRAWKIDRPFAVAPDQTSIVTIVPFNGRVLVIGNRFEDANWVNAGFGTSIEVVYANNQLFRCAQLLNYGLETDGHLQPSWFVQYLDNEMGEGQTGIDVTGGVRHRELYDGPVTRCVVERRNSFAADNGGSISVSGHTRDVLVENCTLRHAENFIRADNPATGLVFRNNKFAAGPPRYTGNQMTNSVIVPAAGADDQGAASFK